MKLALYQGSGTLFDIPTNLELLARTATTAATGGVDFLIFPELFITGYNIGGEVKRLAELNTGESLQYIANIARSQKLAILVGYAEKSEENFYNSAALIDAEGSLVANYRKIHLFGAEEQRLFTPGNQWVLHSIAGFKVGILICYDVEFPEAVRTLALLGAELIAVPTAQMYPYTHIPTLAIPTRALENQLFVAYANRIGTEGDLTYCGLSTVAAPNGQVLIQAREQEEGLSIVNLDRATISLERSVYSYLNERYPELYTF